MSTRKPGSLTETQFKVKVLARIRKIPNSWFEKIQQYSISGTPDILGVVNGVFVALELKKAEKSPITRLQLYNIERINSAGGVGIVLHPGNLDETIQKLEGLNNDQTNI